MDSGKTKKGYQPAALHACTHIDIQKKMFSTFPPRWLKQLKIIACLHLAAQ